MHNLYIYIYIQPSEFTAAFGTAVVNAVVKTNSDGKKLPKLSCV